jgi:hypothetical protein
MKKFLLIILFFLFANISLASDDKPGRFFEDQPDVNDDYQIHFIYTLAKMGKIVNGTLMEEWKKYY